MEKKEPVRQYLTKHYKQLWFILIMCAVLSVVFQLLQLLPFVGDLDDKALDYKFRLAPRPDRADTNVVLVAIDDNTLKFVQNQLQQGWPFPRSFYGLITEYLSEQGARGIIFDVQFYDPDFDRNDIIGAESDQDFADAMQASGKVILSAQLVPDSTEVSENFRRFALKRQRWVKAAAPYQGLLEPIRLFEDNAASLGIVNLTAEREAIIRRLPLYYELQGHYYPNLAYAAWRQFSERQHERPGREQAKCRYIPEDRDGNLLLNWYGEGDIQGVFKYYSFANVLQSAVAKRYPDRKPVLGDGIFRDKYVIIGAKAGGLMDLKSTPYTWSVPGMEIWATALSNLNQQDFVRQAPDWLNWLITLVIVFLVLLLVSRLRSDVSTLLQLGIILLFLSGSELLFKYIRFDLKVVVPIFAFVGSWIFIVTISYVMEGRHKRELRQVFSRYLHPDLVQKIVDEPDMVAMGGEEYTATVMFSDIYNFTGFSEGKEPKELVSYLNDYFSSFTNTVLDYKGLLDKYTGDGLMAVFGVPIAREDHALLACQAALAHRDMSMKLLKQKKKEELTAADNFHINTRLGINSGKIVAGNIGSERRMEYTSIGDAVNLSSRLEGVNKVFKTHIIISEATYQFVKDRMICRELDYLKVKGKNEPTRIYQLLEEKGKADESQFGWIAEYETALASYRQGDFQQAAKLFGKLREKPWEDTAAEELYQRCQHLIANPPAQWDGILTLEEK